jgi:hypothetical protein
LLAGREKELVKALLCADEVNAETAGRIKVEVEVG